MKTYNHNIHAWFYTWLKNNCRTAAEQNIVKEATIAEYSGGKTDSLREMHAKYPVEYKQMRDNLTIVRNQGKANILDLSRKRLIAVLHDYVQRVSGKKNTEYIKRIAARAAGCETFNEIPIKSLKSLYRVFGEKNAALSDKWAKGVLFDVKIGVVRDELEELEKRLPTLIDNKKEWDKVLQRYRALQIEESRLSGESISGYGSIPEHIINN